MGDLQAIADRVEIEALRGEFTDAVMMRDYDRLASLFTPDGAWRLPGDNIEFVSGNEIRAGIERTHPARELRSGSGLSRGGGGRHWTEPRTLMV
jgi:hypothetical protein